MAIPLDYAERVYAGVLGKMIGVYLGRPFEGWLYERILEELGEINYYVHEKRGLPLVVTDDDISGTFTFVRALQDYGYNREITPEQIGQTWLNYIIEGRTILWWGGMGNSTEHTAYLRLKRGISAPCSGSIVTNGQVVAEQIGAQIFIDGWAMVSPGDPEKAAYLAGKAGRVSHDGEAVYAAQVLAAMEAQAFVERDIQKLIDTGISQIPKDSLLYGLIEDLRGWREIQTDWRQARQQVVTHYGYDRYGGNCHVVPNHALIILGLLYGEDDFQKTLMITNTCGWDTDCNSGNVGCLMGIKNGLAGINAGPDWRGPVADRLYLPTADGGRAVTDAVTEAYYLVNTGRALSGLDPLEPKRGARYHFELPGSVQGFRVEDSPECRGTLTLENVSGYSLQGERSLALHYQYLTQGNAARASVPTFIPPEALSMRVYSLIASPTLYPGQVVRARLVADERNSVPVTCRLFHSQYGLDDRLIRFYDPEKVFDPGTAHEYEWRIGESGGAPIAEIGLEISSRTRADGTVFLDYLTWSGEPDVVFRRPDHWGNAWRLAWVNGVDHFDSGSPEPYRLIQDDGTGLLIQGTREWRNYRVTADVTPHMVKSAGIAARVQGMRRYIALLLCDRDRCRLTRVLDGETILSEVDFSWQFGRTYELSLQVKGDQIRAWIDGQLIFDMADPGTPLSSGAVALACEEGRTATQCVSVQPA